MFTQALGWTMRTSNVTDLVCPGVSERVYDPVRHLPFLRFTPARRFLLTTSFYHASARMYREICNYISRPVYQLHACARKLWYSIAMSSKAAAEMGRLRWAGVSEDERRELARAAARKRWDAMTPEERKRAMKKVTAGRKRKRKTSK